MSDKENSSLGFPESMLGRERYMLLLQNDNSIPLAEVLILAAEREGAWHAT